MSYIPLRVQSHWSLLDGVPSVPELVAHAAALGLPALALTDRNALYGAVEFVSACSSAGIFPILGAGLNLAAGGRPQVARNLPTCPALLAGVRTTEERRGVGERRWCDPRLGVLPRFTGELSRVILHPSSFPAPSTHKYL